MFLFYEDMEYFEYRIDALGIYPAPSGLPAVPLHHYNFYRHANYAIAYRQEDNV